MREILFRGKRKDNGEWVEGCLFDDGLIDSNRRFIGSLIIEDYKGFSDDKWDITGTCFYEVFPETVGQYTGLTDKTGKKIFDGDIVITKTGRLCETYWFVSPNMSGWDLKPIECKRLAPPEYDLFLSQNLEVVGNIHDNLNIPIS